MVGLALSLLKLASPVLAADEAESIFSNAKTGAHYGIDGKDGEGSGAETYSQGITNPIIQPETGDNPEEARSGSLFLTMFGGAMRFMMVMAGLWAMIKLIQGGIAWIGAGGDSGKLEKARNTIVQAVIGMIVLSATFAIWLLVKQFLGIETTFEPLFPNQGQSSRLDSDGDGIPDSLDSSPNKPNVGQDSDGDGVPD